MRMGLAKYLWVVCLFWSVPAVAVTYTVTSSNLTGTGTLAKAVEDANARAGADTIDLMGMNGSLVIPRLILRDGVSITGPGKDQLSLQLTDSDINMFYLSGTNENYTIQGIELTGAGIAIEVAESNSLTIFGVRVTGNSSILYGGVHFEGEALTIDQCEFVNNLARTDATAPNVRSGIGGALSIQSPDGTRQTGAVSISRSIFIGNIAYRNGGAIYIADRSNVKISNSTISGNWAQDAGGIYLTGSSVEIFSSTIAANTATLYGSGIYFTGYSLLLSGSVVADNIGDGKNLYCSRDFSISRGYNFIEDFNTDCIGFQATDIVEQDPKLGPLSSIDGGNLGHLPLVDSPLVNAIPSSSGSCETVDQRGLPRPAGEGAFCDIGAIEVECGNNVAELPIEECDDGKDGDNLDECLDSCKLPACGDGIVHVAKEEQCDDGNGVDNDNCNNQCKINVVIGTTEGETVIVTREEAEASGAEVLTITPADFLASGGKEIKQNELHVLLEPAKEEGAQEKATGDSAATTSTTPATQPDDGDKAAIGGGGCSLIPQ